MKKVLKKLNGLNRQREVLQGAIEAKKEELEKVEADIAAIEKLVKRYEQIETRKQLLDQQLKALLEDESGSKKEEKKVRPSVPEEESAGGDITDCAVENQMPVQEEIQSAAAGTATVYTDQDVYNAYGSLFDN